jgi:hypothetical protein
MKSASRTSAHLDARMAARWLAPTSRIDVCRPSDGETGTKLTVAQRCSRASSDAIASSRLLLIKTGQSGRRGNNLRLATNFLRSSRRLGRIKTDTRALVGLAARAFVLRTHHSFLPNGIRNHPLVYLLITRSRLTRTFKAQPGRTVIVFGRLSSLFSRFSPTWLELLPSVDAGPANTLVVEPECTLSAKEAPIAGPSDKTVETASAPANAQR